LIIFIEMNSLCFSVVPSLNKGRIDFIYFSLISPISIDIEYVLLANGLYKYVSVREIDLLIA
jgi:hypothetical protein